MEYQNAKLLNHSLKYWMHKCLEILEATEEGGTYHIVELMIQFGKTDFDRMYDDFIEELISNIKEYRNIEYMDNYIEGAFDVVEGVSGYEDDIDSDIVRNGYEVKFLLEVTRSINQTLKKVEDIFYGKGEYTYSNELKRIFYEQMVLLQPDFQMSDIKDGKENVEDEEAHLGTEERQFDFRCLKKELAGVEGNKEKINLIHNRLIDFEQWFIEKGSEYTQHFLGTKIYAHAEFYKLCMSEIKRYPVQKEPQPDEKIKLPELKNHYNWTGSDTALLELVTALYHSDCIERRDGKTASRKELIDYFQSILGVEIKDVEGKLTRATNRKINRTPFLDNLRVAFESYSVEKEERQRQRR